MYISEIMVKLVLAGNPNSNSFISVLNYLFVCIRGHLSKCRRAPSPDSAREQGATSRELGQSPMPGQPQWWNLRPESYKALVLGYVWIWVEWISNYIHLTRIYNQRVDPSIEKYPDSMKVGREPYQNCYGPRVESLKKVFPEAHIAVHRWRCRY